MNSKICSPVDVHTLLWRVVAILAIACVVPARALVITPPIETGLSDVTSQYVVGYATGSGNASVAVETTIAQHLLNLGLDFGPATQNGITFPGSIFEQGGSSVVVNGVVYATNSVFDYGATLISATKVDTGLLQHVVIAGDALTKVSGGYDFVIAKYDGPNAGLVLFRLDGAADSYIPRYPADLWGTGSSLEISHWIGFNANGITPGPTVPDGSSTLALLGAAFGVLGLMRRRWLAA